MTKQGFQCKDCHYDAHRECADLVPTDCSNICLPWESKEELCMLRNTGNADTMAKKTSTEGNDQAKSTQTVKQVPNMHFQLSAFIHVSDMLKSLFPT